jgi:hypothetical protein
MGSSSQRGTCTETGSFDAIYQGNRDLHVLYRTLSMSFGVIRQYMLVQHSRSLG